MPYLQDGDESAYHHHNIDNFLQNRGTDVGEAAGSNPGSDKEARETDAPIEKGVIAEKTDTGAEECIEYVGTAEKGL